MLVCEAAAKGTLIVLTSEPEPLTLSLIAGTWHSLETIGEYAEQGKEVLPSNEINGLEGRYKPGTGHDCLVIQTPGGVETELTVNQTAELIDKLEILLGKKKASLIEVPPSIIPPSFKM